MGNAIVTSLPQHCDGEVRKEIHLTRRCRDLLVRAGLEGTYLAHFIRDGGAAVIYGLTLERAEALLDALDQLRSEAVHYDKTSLTALERELKRVLFAERTKGLSPDPGFDATYSAVALLLADMPNLARLKVGDRAIECHAGEVTVIEPYGLHKVRCSAGRFYDEDGNQIDYWWGYAVRVAGGGRYIARASDLYDADGRPTYLRPVKSDDAAAPVLGGEHD